MAEFKVGKRKIGNNNPVFIIAEVGINHNGVFENAIRMIDAAAEAGCDAVKFQSFKAKEMYPKTAGTIHFNKLVYPIHERVKTFELPDKWLPRLKEHCEKKNMIFFSSISDITSLNIADKYLDMYKLTSYDITNIPLQTEIAKRKKPIIFSTGGATMKEVIDAYENMKRYNDKLAILHCIIKYPCPLKACNMNVIKTLKNAFPDAVIGYSDHTTEPTEAPVAAVALGAKIIEKHITLDKNMEGPDHSFALEPEQLKEMVNAIRETEEKLKNNEKIKVDENILGSGKRETKEIEKYLKDFCYRTIFTTRKIKKGERITKDIIAVLRPGEKKKGLEPKYYDEIINKYVAKKDMEKEHLLTWDDIQK